MIAAYLAIFIVSLNFSLSFANHYEHYDVHTIQSHLGKDFDIGILNINECRSNENVCKIRLVVYQKDKDGSQKKSYVIYAKDFNDYKETILYMKEISEPDQIEAINKLIGEKDPKHHIIDKEMMSHIIAFSINGKSDRHTRVHMERIKGILRHGMSPLFSTFYARKGSNVQIFILIENQNKNHNNNLIMYTDNHVEPIIYENLDRDSSRSIIYIKEHIHKNHTNAKISFDIKDNLNINNNVIRHLRVKDANNDCDIRQYPKITCDFEDVFFTELGSRTDDLYIIEICYTIEENKCENYPYEIDKKSGTMIIRDNDKKLKDSQANNLECSILISSHLKEYIEFSSGETSITIARNIVDNKIEKFLEEAKKILNKCNKNLQLFIFGEADEHPPRSGENLGLSEDRARWIAEKIRAQANRSGPAGLQLYVDWFGSSRTGKRIVEIILADKRTIEDTILKVTKKIGNHYKVLNHKDGYWSYYNEDTRDVKKCIDLVKDCS